MLNEEYWVQEKASFFDVEDGILIKWKGKYDEDLYQLSKSYMLCAYYATKDILENANVSNRRKYDMWFLPCVYMFRQSIELILKGLVAVYYKNKRHDFELALNKDKHNLVKLYERYFCNVNEPKISEDEQCWLKEFLSRIGEIDKNSGMFRYPFNDNFLNQYNNDFLDICDMGNSLLNAYAILDKEYTGVMESEIYDIDVSRKKDFLFFSSDAFGNCHLWESSWGDGFHKQIVGYSEVANYLYEKYINERKDDYIFPIMFLLRNAIELSLKRLLFAKVIHGVDPERVKKTRHEHSLKKLWEAVNVMLREYAGEQDLRQLEYLEKNIMELDKIDDKGNTFRYPFSCNLSYKFQNQTIDIKNIFEFMAGILNLLDCCDTELSVRADQEAEMLYELQSSLW